MTITVTYTEKLGKRNVTVHTQEIYRIRGTVGQEIDRILDRYKVREIKISGGGETVDANVIAVRVLRARNG